MIDLKRLNDLFAATTQKPWHAIQYADNWCLQDGPDYGDRKLDGGDQDQDMEWECTTVPTDEGEVNMRFAAESHNTWPAVAARLELLEKFAARVRSADESSSVPTAEMLLSESVAWLDAETKKAGR